MVKLSTKKNEEFAARLKVLIEERLSIKQCAFAQSVGISESYLSQILKGKGPSAGLISGIFLNYSEHLYWLLTGKEPTDDGKIAEVMKQLAEIGEIDRELFGQVIGYTRATLDAARKSKK